MAPSGRPLSTMWMSRSRKLSVTSPSALEAARDRSEIWLFEVLETYTGSETTFLPYFSMVEYTPANFKGAEAPYGINLTFVPQRDGLGLRFS